MDKQEKCSKKEVVHLVAKVSLVTHALVHGGSWYRELEPAPTDASSSFAYGMTYSCPA